jgi:2-polyprenyl-6-methoxyphenol hydroxylase-like FAD-dependent oxidoreductase
MKNKKVVIVGGGPVGLTQAIILKQLGFSSIKILEKRKEYTRSQIISIDPTYFNTLYPKNLIKEIEKKVCYRTFISQDSTAMCNLSKYNFDPYTINKNNIIIKIKDFENILKSFVKKDIFYISNLEIDTKKNIVNGNKYDFLIGADGVNSQVRKEIFKEEFKDIVSRTYYTATFSFCCDTYFVDIEDKVNLEFQRNQPRIRVFRSKDGTYTIAMALQEEEYNKIKKGDLPIKFLKYLFKVHGFKGHPKKTMLSYNAFPLEIGHVETVYKKMNGAKYFLVGDSSYSTHYFTGSGLNTGIFNSFMVARDIIKPSCKFNYQTYFKDRALERKQFIQTVLLPSKEKALETCNIKPWIQEYYSREEACYLDYVNDDIDIASDERYETNRTYISEFELLITIPFFKNRVIEMLKSELSEINRYFKTKGIPFNLVKFKNTRINFPKIVKKIHFRGDKITYSIVKSLITKNNKLEILYLLGFPFSHLLEKEHFKEFKN